MSLGMLRLLPPLSWQKALEVCFWIDTFTEKILESQKDCTKVIGNGSLCEACVSFYRESTREGGNGRRKSNMCGDR